MTEITTPTALRQPASTVTPGARFRVLNRCRMTRRAKAPLLGKIVGRRVTLVRSIGLPSTSERLGVIMKLSGLLYIGAVPISERGLGVRATIVSLVWLRRTLLQVILELRNRTLSVIRGQWWANLCNSGGKWRRLTRRSAVSAR